MRVAAALLAAMLVLSAGCQYLRRPLRPYTSGMGPATWDRFQRVMKFQTEYEVLTQARITGGGYNIDLQGPNAERAMGLLMSTRYMGEPTEPVHALFRCLAIHGRDPSIRTIRFGFDPRIAGHGTPSTKFAAMLSDLRKFDKQAVSDSRLSRTFSILSRGFNHGNLSIEAVDVALASGYRRRLTSPRDIAILLGDFAGVRRHSIDGMRGRDDIKLAIRYTESGKQESFVEAFGTNEAITRPGIGDMQISLAKLASKLKRGELPAWENLVVVP